MVSSRVINVAHGVKYPKLALLVCFDLPFIGSAGGCPDQDKLHLFAFSRINKPCLSVNKSSQ